MTTMLATLLLGAFSTRVPQPAAISTVGLNLGCVFVSQREFAQRGLHAVACVVSTGEVRGALLKRNGIPRCTFGGFVDANGCVTLTGACGGTTVCS